MTERRPIRVPPVDDVGVLDEDARELLAESDYALRSAPNCVMTLVRNPSLARSFLRFAGTFRESALPVRLRELVILRVAWRTGSEYEWSHHTELALSRGVNEEEVARIPRGPDAEGWTRLEAALLRAVDDLHDHSTVRDATWAQLVEHLDEAQLIELPILVGHYHGVAYFMNTLGVPWEPGYVGLPARSQRA